MQRRSFDFDWLTALLYLALVFIGWLTIYTVSSESGSESLLKMDSNHGKQLIWIGISCVAAIVIIVLDSRFLEAISYFLYGFSILLLLLVLLIGKEVNGAQSWLVIGGIQIQPAEFAKVATAMAIAKYMSSIEFSMDNLRQFLIASAIIVMPALIVILQNDTGSALVFGSFMIVFFREGLNPLIPILLIILAFIGVLTLAIGNFWIILLILFVLAAISFAIFFNKKNLSSMIVLHMGAIAIFALFSFSVGKIITKLPQHQQNRIMVLIDPSIDPQGVGYNVIQSKIAIGSGGFSGKGFLQGNYTKYRFVPKQVTDFIFCTIGEEWGWLGSFTTIILFFLLLMRIKYISENGKTRYARIYGYSILGIIFFHVMVNIGMTIGLVPVIGIPLPFFSYGGSSLLAFTILLFIMINHYSYRGAILGAKY